MKRSALFMGSVSMLVCLGCTQPVPHPSDDAPSSTTRSPTPSSTSEPTSAWHIQEAQTNPIDGTRTQFLTVGSIEGKSESHYISGLGSIPINKSTAKIVLCFENGKLCRGSSVGARVDIDGFVSTDGSAVRLKFDDSQPIRQHWAGTDSHDSLFPYGHEGQFLFGLLGHSKLFFEFSKYEEAPQVVTFDVAGLAEIMKKAGLKP